MSRQKTKKFHENKTRENVIEEGKPWYDNLKGKWSEFFGNENDLVLELACGKGEYTVGLATIHRNKNFIGIDIKGDRLWVGSGKALELGLKNVAFLRTDINFLERFFEKGEVSEIWLTFPDPRPKKRDEKRRLTHPGFVDSYRMVLKKGGWFRFVTDNTQLFDYTLDLIERKKIMVNNLKMTTDLYKSDLNEDHHGIVTRYEKMFFEAGETIKYLKFQFCN